MSEAPAILFVCLGNICRSPLAEGAMRVLAAERGLALTIDSAGIGGWHAGDPPDPRARAVALRHDVSIDDLRARQVLADDFVRFDHIVALDRQNLADLRAMRPAGGAARISLLLDHAPGRAGQDVADPYYGDDRDFERAWADARAGVAGLIDMIARSLADDHGQR